MGAQMTVNALTRPVGYGSGYGSGYCYGDGDGYGYGYGTCSPNRSRRL